MFQLKYKLYICTLYIYTHTHTVVCVYIVLPVHVYVHKCVCSEPVEGGVVFKNTTGSCNSFMSPPCSALESVLC